MLLCSPNFLFRKARRDKWTNWLKSWTSFSESSLQRFAKKEDNEEYEPNYLRAFFASSERHLKKKNYGICIMKDVQFERTLKALQSKQRDQNGMYFKFWTSVELFRHIIFAS